MTLAIIQVNFLPKCHHVVLPTLSKNTKEITFFLKLAKKYQKRTQNGGKNHFFLGCGAIPKRLPGMRFIARSMFSIILSFPSGVKWTLSGRSIPGRGTAVGIGTILELGTMWSGMTFAISWLISVNLILSLYRGPDLSSLHTSLTTELPWYMLGFALGLFIWNKRGRSAHGMRNNPGISNSQM